MKLDMGDVETLDKTKSADVICESHKPEIIGVIFGVITTAITTVIGRRLYKEGAEASLNAETKALSDIGALAHDPEKPFKAKVLK